MRKKVKVRSGGGFRAIWYTIKKGREAGGLWKLIKAMRTPNACKTCALGMGGQKGGMVNEKGGFPEVCKKSLQAMVADMQGPIESTFWIDHPISHLKTLSPRELEHQGRLIRPIRYRAGTDHYEEITWQKAIEAIVEKLRATEADKTFWYFSGRSSNEAGFLLQLLARVFGTNNVNNCSYYCHQASGVGLQSSVGSGTATIVLDDLEKADTVFLIGGNPPSNHPRIMTSLMHVRRRGGKVIVINPVRETGLVKFRVPSDPRSLLFGTKIATQYVQPHIGGDLALLWGIAKAVKQQGNMTKTSSVNIATTTKLGSKRSTRSLGWRSKRNPASPVARSNPSPKSMANLKKPCLPGRWASLTTPMVSTTSKPSPHWRYVAGWLADPVVG